MNTIVLSAILFLFLLRVKLSFNDMGVTFETTNTLKALACVFVVIHHSSKLLSDDNFLINIYKIHVGYIAVAIFFIYQDMVWLNRIRIKNVISILLYGGGYQRYIFLF